MRTKKTVEALVLTAILASVVSSSPADEKPASDLKTYSSALLGVSFQYPNRFLIGRYLLPKMPDMPAEVKDLGMAEPFKNAIVLIEPKELGTRSTNAIPVGEVATISLELKTGFEAQFTKQNFCQDKFKQTIGSRNAYKLPGYPGPYGENLFYYLVPLETGILEIVAHKTFLSKLTQAGQAFQQGDPAARDRVRNALDNPESTEYDKVIEAIIKTMKEQKAKETPQQAPGTRR